MMWIMSESWPSPFSPVGETRQLTPVLIILSPSFFLDVQKCAVRSSGAETQHACLPGIISMAKNNLILSESVKILFAWLWRVSLCLSVLWQAGDVHAGCCWNHSNCTGTFHWAWFETRHVYLFQRCDIFSFLHWVHKGQPCFSDF